MRIDSDIKDDGTLSTDIWPGKTLYSGVGLITNGGDRFALSERDFGLNLKLPNGAWVEIQPVWDAGGRQTGSWKISPLDSAGEFGMIMPYAHPAEAEAPEADGSEGCSFAEQADLVARLKERWKQGIKRTRPIIDPIPGWDINAQVFLIREWEGISGFVSDVGYKYDAGVYTIKVARDLK